MAHFVVFTVPVYRKGKESKEPGALELEVGEGELLPEVDGEDLPKHEEGDPGTWRSGRNSWSRRR